jgi:hypothetical protein
MTMIHPGNLIFQHTLENPMLVILISCSDELSDSFLLLFLNEMLRHFQRRTRWKWLYSRLDSTKIRMTTKTKRNISSIILPDFVDRNLQPMNSLDSIVLNLRPHLSVIHLVMSLFVKYHDRIVQN